MIRRALNSALARVQRQRGENRTTLAAELSALTGRRISKVMLDSYTGAGRANRLPADLLPALCVLLGPELLSAIAGLAGCQIMTRDEVILAQAGKVIYLEDFLSRKKQQLLEQLPQQELL